MQSMVWGPEKRKRMLAQGCRKVVKSGGGGGGGGGNISDYVLLVVP